MLCVSVGTWAYNFPGNSASDVKDYDEGKTVSFFDEGSDTQRLVVGAGGLAEWFNDATVDKSYLSSTSRTKLVITGTLNADDIAAIKTYFTPFTTVDMEGATLEEGASVKGMQLPNAQYMALPHGTPIADMKTLKSGCPKLKAVAATNADSPTEFTGYSWAAGEIWNICQLGLVDGIASGICANTMQKLTIGGNVNDKDASTIAASSSNSNENSSFKTTTATYSLNGANADCAHDYIAPTNSNSGNGCSPWVGNTEISLDFTEAIFENKGDLALISPNATELLLPTESTFTEIKPFMFANLKKLRKIIVPNNIVTIGDGAFYVDDNSSLVEEISIGSGIKTIGNAAFAAPTSTGSARSHLTDIRFANGISDVKILASVFNGCNSIKHMMLPEGIVSIGERCFNQLSELESVHFPSTLEYIGRDCFRQTGLVMLTIPKSVKVIDYNAFSLCRITDLFLMAENVDQLPYIYAMTYDYTSGGDGIASTFDSNMLNGNNTTAGTDEHDDFATSTPDEAEELFRLSVNGGNTITRLHYSDGLKDFIDLNPWYFEGQTTQKPASDTFAGIATDPYSNGNITETKHLSDTYYLKDKEDNTYPAADAGDLSRPSWSAYYNSESHTWSADGSNTDYTKEAGTQQPYYDPATGVLSAVTEDTQHVYKVLRKEGWRQFTFKTGDATSEDVVFNKSYENIWYTMCFPFGLTDEQLESAFNAEYNIADFSGVEVNEENENGNREIILHFNTIAKAKYYDLDYNEYTRDDSKKEQRTAPNGALFNTYEYSRNGQTYKYVSTFSNKSYAINGDKSNGLVYIDGYLAQPGHPYMIHPNLGTKQGDLPVVAHMVGINYYSRDAQVIDQLCKDRARSIDLGTGKGYEGVTYSLEDASDIAVKTENELEENFQQAAYSNYPGQTYSFVGNCNEYTADAPAYPTVENGGLEALPNIEDYVDAKYLPNGPVKAEQGPEPPAPTVEELPVPTDPRDNPVANPADDKATYSEAFQTLYNTIHRTGVWNGSASVDYTYGEDIVSLQITDFGDAQYAYLPPDYSGTFTGYKVKDNASALKAYWGLGDNDQFQESDFTALQTLCSNYADALVPYNEYLADVDNYKNVLLPAYEENKQIWDEYRAAYAEWNSFSEEQAQAEYEDARVEYGSQVGQYNGEVQRVNQANEGAVAQWRNDVKAYAVFIPENAYFLSRNSGEYYTHFFREKASLATRKTKGTGKWTRYSAVLIPNSTALSGVEVAQDPAASKAFNMVFDESFTAVEPTAIEQIVEEAKEKGQSVQYMDVVVSVNGQVVRRGDTSLEGLPSGIYIINGKKYFVK